MKKVIIRLVLLAAVAAGAWYGYNFFQQMPARQATVATAKVRRGDVVVRTYARGELRAVRSVTLTAPNLFGTVQVTRLAALGSLSKEKDLIIEFDDSELQSRLEEKQLELDQIDEQIKKSQADLAIRDNQDQVELLRTRYSVRRADLEVKRNELLSAIDAKKNLLTLDESKRRLTQLESDIKSRREQAQAELAVFQERRNKSVLELNRERARLLQVKMLSPMTGLVAIRQNRAGGFFVPGMAIPDIREGDQVQPGMPVADVLDLSEMEVIARVGELDRANLHEDQEVIMHLDALPETKLNGKIKSMSAMATSSVFSNDPAKKFDVLFSVDMRELLKALGAKPDQITRILQTAEQNRKKPIDGAPSAGVQANATAGMPVPVSTAPAPKKEGGMPGGMPSGMPPGLNFTSKAQFSAKDIENANLPPPPEETSQLEVLLRPGMLSDVEIIVERIPNAVHIPIQAIFEKDRKQIVFVKAGSKWEERPIRIAKRSEATVVIEQGVKEGDIVALADPTAKPGKKKGKDEGGGSGGAMGSLPGGK